jgi:hypothetical protein
MLTKWKIMKIKNVLFLMMMCTAFQAYSASDPFAGQNKGYDINQGAEVLLPGYKASKKVADTMVNGLVENSVLRVVAAMLINTKEKKLSDKRLEIFLNGLEFAHYADIQHKENVDKLIDYRNTIGSFAGECSAFQEPARKEALRKIELKLQPIVNRDILEAIS